MTKLIDPIQSAATRGARVQATIDHLSMIPESEWKRRFIEKFSSRMRSAGYDGEPDLAECAQQHAGASYECRDADDVPEAAADAEFEALSDSI